MEVGCRLLFTLLGSSPASTIVAHLTSVPILIDMCTKILIEYPHRTNRNFFFLYLLKFLHLTKVWLFKIQLPCKSIQVDSCRIKYYLLNHTLDALDKVCIWLKILLSTFEHYLEKSCQNWPPHVFHFLISILKLPKIKLLEDILTLRSAEFPHQFLFIICRRPFVEILRFPDDCIFKDALAENWIEIIPVKKFFFCLNSLPNILFSSGMVRKRLKLRCAELESNKICFHFQFPKSFVEIKPNFSYLCQHLINRRLQFNFFLLWAWRMAWLCNYRNYTILF